MRLTTPTLYRIIGPDGPVGEPGAAHKVSNRCTELNDAANPDEGKPRVVVYRVEKVTTCTYCGHPITGTVCRHAADSGTYHGRCLDMMLLSQENRDRTTNFIEAIKKYAKH